MAEQAFGSQQAVMVVDRHIVMVLRIELFGKRDFGVVFRQMRLHVQVGEFPHQRAGHVQLFGAGGNGETRRDGHHLAALAMPFLDDCLGIVIARLRRIEQGRRRIAIHHHLAGDHAEIAPVAFAEKRLGGALVNGAIGHGAGCAMAHKLVEKGRGDARRVNRINKFLLLDECIGVEPFEQSRRIGADHLHLRKVQMGVDEAGHHQMGSVINRDGLRRCLLFHARIIARGDDHAVRGQDRAIFLIAVG